MQPNRITGFTTDTYFMGSSRPGEKWIFEATSITYDTAYNGIQCDADNSTIILNGYASGSAGYSAISSSASNTSITVGKDGMLVGGTGIYSTGVDADIVNNGTLVGGAGYAGILMAGYSSEFHNRGVARGSAGGIDMRSDDGLVVNEKDGLIYGIGVYLSEDQSSRIINHGQIRGVVYGSVSEDHVVNNGAITGNVSLGDGKDTLDNRGGKIAGDISGGRGDDIFITDNAGKHLIEYDGDGEDIVRSSVSYTLDPTYYIERLQLIGNKNINATGTERGEELWGNAGDNVLNGKGGMDFFDGRAGNDMLKGGAGTENRFFFGTGYDRDTIQHFDEGLDRIFVGGWRAISDFGDIKSHAHNQGENVVIADGDDSLTIFGLHKADLQADDFIFLL